LAFDDLVLRSVVEGSVTTMGRLTLAPGSRTRATLTCGTLESAGRLEGRVLSYGPITLSRKSVTVGEVTARSLKVEAGARLEGRLRITARPEPFETSQPRTLVIPGIEPTARRHGLTHMVPRR
jgi:cytoskeletal protein CcmA (bactofilin family)